jgi:hypothetical protein
MNTIMGLILDILFHNLAWFTAPRLTKEEQIREDHIQAYWDKKHGLKPRS